MYAILGNGFFFVDLIIIINIILLNVFSRGYNILTKLTSIVSTILLIKY